MDIDLKEGEKGEKDTSKKSKLPLKLRIKEFFANPKKRLIFEIVLGVILIGIFWFGIHTMTKDKLEPKAENKEEVAATPEPIKYPSILDGVLITDKEAAEKHPLAVIIENDPQARPQSGLNKASIVYETVYDPAATTRFMAIFGENEAEKVGPIRSIRTFFVDWAHGYDAFLGHWGGNIDALDKILAEKAYDLDEFRYPGPYWREGSGVASDHTGYTSTIKLRNQAAANKYPTANNFTVYKFKDDATDLPESQKISINYSNASYKVDFNYNKKTNSYDRVLAGAAHTDAVDKTQLSPKNVIVMTVARKSTTTRINEPGYTMTTVGSGKASIFMDGKTITGTWKKNAADEREVFYDAAGNEITFNRGQFWICVVASDNVVTTQ